MPNLREFFRKYGQYVVSDGLMYLIFIVALGLMFLFFR